MSFSRHLPTCKLRTIATIDISPRFDERELRPRGNRSDPSSKRSSTPPRESPSDIAPYHPRRGPAGVSRSSWRPRQRRRPLAATMRIFLGPAAAGGARVGSTPRRRSPSPSLRGNREKTRRGDCPVRGRGTSQLRWRRDSTTTWRTFPREQRPRPFRRRRAPLQGGRCGS